MPAKAGVGANHPQYERAAPQWKLLRDAVDGEVAIKAAGREYLPALDKQEITEYDSYLKRATWFNATRRTVEGMHGMIFRRDLTAELPPGLRDQWEKDIDRRGTDINSFAQAIVSEVIVVGRGGLLLDLPEVAESTTVPHLCFYNAESICDWREESIGGVRQLVHLVLSEAVDVPDENGFGHNVKRRRLVLRLTDRAYSIEKFELRKSTETSEEDWVSLGFTQPTVRGQKIAYIPFIFLSRGGVDCEIDESPLLDLAYLNVSHYRTSADLEHGCHYVALPTPVIMGMGGDIERRNLPLGPTNVIWLPADGDAKFLEFSGKGLSTLQERMAEKERQMVVLGSRLLEQQKAAVEASETVKVRQSGDRSVLAQIARQCSRAMTAVAQWAATWIAASEKTVSINLNSEFYDQPLSPDGIRALVQAWQAGAMSKDTMLWNLKRGDVIAEGVSVEDEKDRIDADPPGDGADAVGSDKADAEDDDAAA